MATAKPACADARNAFGKPDAGDPHVRFDEGEGASMTLLLYSTDPRAFWLDGNTIREAIRFSSDVDRSCSLLSHLLDRPVGEPLGGCIVPWSVCCLYCMVDHESLSHVKALCLQSKADFLQLAGALTAKVVVHQQFRKIVAP